MIECTVLNTTKTLSILYLSVGVVWFTLGKGMPRDETRIYVGNLPSDARERDIEDVFTKYGSIKFVDIKGGRGPLYAFLEFNDPRDAEDAVRGRNGYDFDGRRLRVEFTRGQGNRERGGGRFDDRGGQFRRGGAHPSKRTKNRVLIEGLPPSGSWQDLKDHMRDAGEVCYADVAKDGTGVVEFARYEDVKYAIRKLDDTKFRSHEGETTYIKVREDTTGGRRSRSRSPRYSPRNSRSRSRTRSRSRSRSRSASRSKSRTKSPSKSRSRSASRSRSQSRSRSRST